MKRTIRCLPCRGKVEARLTDGAEMYPHRLELAEIPFWKCDRCGYWVGCHHRSRDRTRPLGSIPTVEIKRMRIKLHGLIDPLWQSGRFGRTALYREIGKRLGVKEYHTAGIDSVEQAQLVIEIVRKLTDTLEIEAVNCEVVE